MKKYDFYQIILIALCRHIFCISCNEYYKTNKGDEGNGQSFNVQYLLKHGLRYSYVGELCRDTGVAPSGLYYYFENKDDISISAGKYGLSKVVYDLFEVERQIYLM